MGGKLYEPEGRIERAEKSVPINIEHASHEKTFQRGSRLVLSIRVDRGSLSTNHELASQTHHQMPTFRLLGCNLL